MNKEFFPPRPDSKPVIYAYEDTNPQCAGLLKVGYTTLDVQTRVAQQYPTKKPGKPPYRIVLEESAMRNGGTAFTDHDVHTEREKGTDGRRKGIQEQAQTDSGKAYQICYPHTAVHVFD